MSFSLYSGPGGKYRYKFKFRGKQYTKIVQTKKEGLAWRVAKEKQIKATPKVQLVGLTFSEMSQTYLEDCQARMQPQTVSEKYRHFTAFAEYMGTDFEIESLTIKHAQKYISQVQQAKTNKTANRHLRNLKACWNWHRSHGEPIPNPWVNVPAYPEESFTKYVPSPEDVASVLLAADRFAKDFLTLILQTAARPSEIRLLTWDDIHFERRAVVLWTRKRKKGERQPRLVRMTDSMKEVLERKWKEFSGGAYVFINPETGEEYSRQSPIIRDMMKLLCERVGIKHFDMYSLRHYVSQRLIDGGKAKGVDIQRLLGHQNLSTTDAYIRSLSPDLSHLDEELDNLMKSSEKKQNVTRH